MSTNGSSAVSADRGDALPRAGFWTLMIGSIGVVYGDIGTSPLYAIRESVNAASGHTGNFTPDMVLGVLSLIFWSLVIVVTIKYVFFLLYADNKGEGGTLSLMALVQRAVGRSSLPIIILGIVGAAHANILHGILGVSLGGGNGYLNAGFIRACNLIALARAIRR